MSNNKTPDACNIEVKVPDTKLHVTEITKQKMLSAKHCGGTLTASSIFKMEPKGE